MLSAYVRTMGATTQIAYSKRTGVSWAAAANIAGTTNAVDIALAALPGTDMAVVAYRDSATNILYTSVYNGTAWFLPAVYAWLGLSDRLGKRRRYRVRS